MRARHFASVLSTEPRCEPPTDRASRRGVTVFVETVHARIGRVGIAGKAGNHRVGSDRLWALIEAGVFLSEELDLRVVLGRVVDTAQDVIGAEYAALGVLDEEGTGLADFIFRGLSDDFRERIGDLPVGRGLLGALISEPKPVRLRNLADDPRSVGFPPNHPPMYSFLGVPVRSKGRIFGNLYLTEKRGAAEFTEEDERLAIALAAHAGVAIENARLYEDERQRAEIERELSETRVRAELRDQTLKAVIRAQEEERRRVARELHDSAGQALASILLGLKAATQEQDASKAVARLADLREIVAGAARDVRRMVRELRPSVLDDLGLAAALERYVTDLRERSDLRVEAKVDLGDVRLDPEIETVMYRVVQEVLTNIVKHARATSVSVSVRTIPEAYVLSVTDDGTGFDVNELAERGLGIRGMHERADLVGGRLDVTSMLGGGTTIVLEVPRKGER